MPIQATGWNRTAGHGLIGFNKKSTSPVRPVRVNFAQYGHGLCVRAEIGKVVCGITGSQFIEIQNTDHAVGAKD